MHSYLWSTCELIVVGSVATLWVTTQLFHTALFTAVFVVGNTLSFFMVLRSLTTIFSEVIRSMFVGFFSVNLVFSTNYNPFLLLQLFIKRLIY